MCVIGGFYSTWHRALLGFPCDHRVSISFGCYCFGEAAWQPLMAMPLAVSPLPIWLLWFCNPFLKSQSPLVHQRLWTKKYFSSFLKKKSFIQLSHSVSPLCSSSFDRDPFWMLSVLLFIATGVCSTPVVSSMKLPRNVFIRLATKADFVKALSCESCEVN